MSPLYICVCTCICVYVYIYALTSRKVSEGMTTLEVKGTL